MLDKIKHDVIPDEKRTEDMPEKESWSDEDQDFSNKHDRAKGSFNHGKNRQYLAKPKFNKIPRR